MSASPVVEALAQPAPPPMSGAPPGAPPQGHPFKDALAEEWARTANAEGQKRGSRTGDPEQRTEAHDRRRAAHDAGQTPVGAAGSQATEPRAAHAASTSEPSTSREPAARGAKANTEATAKAAGAAAGSDAAAKTSARGEEQPLGPLEASGEPAAPTGPGAPTGPAAPTAPGAPTGPAAPSTTSAAFASLATGASQAAVNAPSAAEVAPAQGEGPAQAQSPAAAAAPAPAGPAMQQLPAAEPVRQTGDATHLQTAPLPSAVAFLAGEDGHAKGAPPKADSSEKQLLATARPAVATSTSEAPGAPVAAGGAPVLAGQAPGGAAAAPAAAGVQMQDMIEAIHATIELASRQGMSQARISLHPAELGDIRIHLSQTGDGLLARVTAETPAAAQALMAARGELHQALSSPGSTLLRLDIGSFGQSEGREERHTESSSSTSRSSGTTDGGESIDPAGGPDAAGVASPQVLGELVDVLA